MRPNAGIWNQDFVVLTWMEIVYTYARIAEGVFRNVFFGTLLEKLQPQLSRNRYRSEPLSLVLLVLCAPYEKSGRALPTACEIRSVGHGFYGELYT
jgi:hypothetical protein